MRPIKKVISVLLTVAFILSCSVVVFAYEKTANATRTTSAVLVNGSSVSFEAYNINGNNYFKLRDVAKALSGTEKQFDVTWDNTNKAINMVSGSRYTVVGGEMMGGDGAVKTATINTSSVYKDKVQITLTAYTINGNNFFKLRDIGEAFNFRVTWDGIRNTISIDTSKTVQVNKSSTNTPILSQLPYIGDISQCQMTSDMANAYANVLYKEKDSISELEGKTFTYAALVDVSGDGHPILIYASASEDGSPDGELSIWSYSNGKASEMKYDSYIGLEHENYENVGIENESYGISFANCSIASLSGNSYLLITGLAGDPSPSNYVFYSVSNGVIKKEHDFTCVYIMDEVTDVTDYKNKGYKLCCKKSSDSLPMHFVVSSKYGESEVKFTKDFILGLDNGLSKQQGLIESWYGLNTMNKEFERYSISELAVLLSDIARKL